MVQVVFSTSNKKDAADFKTKIDLMSSKIDVAHVNHQKALESLNQLQDITNEICNVVNAHFMVLSNKMDGLNNKIDELISKSISGVTSISIACRIDDIFVNIELTEKTLFEEFAIKVFLLLYPNTRFSFFFNFLNLLYRSKHFSIILRL